ncbi:unnamed protein product [Lymnaea stagnalis]|uniref:Cathepsin O n=1 Tax=Lymnaea stagnalis TaxID=6523 RepID=A0AAV2HX16_LYMST
MTSCKMVDHCHFRYQFVSKSVFLFRFSSFILYSMLIIGLYSIFIQANELIKDPLYKEFLEFAIKYKKPYIFRENSKNGSLTNSNSYTYNNSESVLHFRFTIFKENVARANLLNNETKNVLSPVYGVNKFADISPMEFKAKYLTGLKHRNGRKTVRPINGIVSFQVKDTRNLAPPRKFDWREKGVVNPIMDQGSCGACWAFSVVETIESMYAIQQNTTSPPHLSVQELIDCDSKNMGCVGGDIQEACDWAQQHCVVWADSYPLTDKTDTCKRLPPETPCVHLKSCNAAKYVDNESTLLDLIAEHGPIAVAIDATTWHNYVGGIIQYHCSETLNHAVQIVGYNLEGDVPYYIIRNSWGSDFGDNGYVYVKYGGNVCGLANLVVSLDTVRTLDKR